MTEVAAVKETKRKPPAALSTAVATNLEPIKRLSKDILAAVENMGVDEARFVVDAYYAMQDNRIAAAGQVRSLTKSGEPNAIMQYLESQDQLLEDQIKRALGRFAENNPVGKRLLEVVGIGDVLAAGFLAHLDVTKTKSAGGFWRYAGLDPTQKWLKGQKRPWNAQLKVLCYKTGESFVKTQNLEKSVYGKIFAERKQLEWRNNLAGQYSEQATGILAEKNFGADTDARKWLSGQYVSATLGESPIVGVKPDATNGEVGIPMLPPAHIHARARRYAVKMFLSHLFEVMWKEHYGTEPPIPFIMHFPPHSHYIPPSF
jgi:hypothetical protein